MESSVKDYKQVNKSSHFTNITKDEQIPYPFMENISNQSLFDGEDVEFDKFSRTSATALQYRNSSSLKITDDVEDIAERFSQIDTHEELPEREFSQKFDYDSDIALKSEESIGKSLTLQKEDQMSTLSTVEQRLNVISELKKVWEERKSLKLKNGFLHKKCKDFLGKYKITSYFEKSTPASMFSDKRYEEILDAFQRIHLDVVNAQRHSKDELEELQFAYQNHQTLFDELNHNFTARLLQVAGECVEEKYASKKIQTPLLKYQKRLSDVTNVRIKYFKLQHLLERINKKDDAVNVFGGGQTIINYTNLLAAKNRLLERLDERDEEILKIRKKFFNYAPILSHMRETSSGLARDIEKLSTELEEVDETNQQYRIFVVNEGRKRDQLRQEFFKLYQSAFLLVHPKLMNALFNSAEELKTLKLQIEQLKLLLKH